MAGTWFDHLTRRAAARHTRRGALRATGAVGLALISLLGGHAAPEVAARACVRPGGRCRRGETRCCSTAKCKRNRCTCPRRTKPCQNTCIPTDSCCGGCRPGTTCDNGACRDRCGQADGECVIFTTSELFTGALGGLAGANANCNRLATDAGLPGTYLAWLSTADGGSSPASSDGFDKSPGRYVRTDGQVIAANWTELTSGTLRVPINRDEAGRRLSTPTVETLVWTNTTPAGFAVSSNPNETCGGWQQGNNTSSGRVGELDKSTSSWTLQPDALYGCARDVHLYCVQQTAS